MKIKIKKCRSVSKRFKINNTNKNIKNKKSNTRHLLTKKSKKNKRHNKKLYITKKVNYKRIIKLI